MNDIALNSVPTRRPDMRFRVVGDEGIIVSQDQAEVIAVNEVGARVLSLVDGERTLGEILTSVGEEFDVSSETLERDTRPFLSELVDSGVLGVHVE